MTHETACLGIVLAAGEGTRMKSATPKVLHPVGGRPMLDAVLASARAGGIKRLAVVIGAGADLLRSHLARSAADVAVHEQTARLGTAHAVLAAAAAIRPDEDVIVLYGDTPLVEGATIARLRARLAEGVDIAVLGFRARDPFGYGRLILADGRLTAIVEERDADAATRAVDLCNSGIMAFRAGLLPDLLEAVGNANAKGEYYLTDTVAIGVGRGLVAAVVEGDEDEFTGVNDRVQLAAAEAGFQRRARRAAMLGGATLVAPETVFFSHDTRLGHDVTIAPNVVFGPGVSIANDVTIHAFSHIEAAHVDSGEPLPRALYDRLVAARNYQSGMQTVRQIEFSLFDMLLHSEFDPAGPRGVLDLLDAVRREVAVTVPPEWNRFPNSFSHIFAGGYAADYYSYKWAEVLSADSYAAFEEAGDPFDPEVGRRFLDEIIAAGGARPALENFRAFRGRDPQVDALLRHSGMIAG